MGGNKETKKETIIHSQRIWERTPDGYKQGKVAYTVIDDATRWSYAKLYRTANAENTVDFLKELLKRSPFDIQKIRMDNGTEFIAHRVQNYIKDQNIEIRYNTPYCPEENGKIERFHRTLNEKSISLFWSPQDSMENLQFKFNIMKNLLFIYAGGGECPPAVIIDSKYGIFIIIIIGVILLIGLFNRRVGIFTIPEVNCRFWILSGLSGFLLLVFAALTHLILIGLSSALFLFAMYSITNYSSNTNSSSKRRKKEKEKKSTSPKE